MRRRGVTVEGEEGSRIILVGETSCRLMPADIVPPAFQKRYVDRPRKRTTQGLEKSRQIAVDDLGLKGKGGRRDDRGCVTLHGMRDERKQIGQ